MSFLLLLLSEQKKGKQKRRRGRARGAECSSCVTTVAGTVAESFLRGVVWEFFLQIFWVSSSFKKIKDVGEREIDQEKSRWASRSIGLVRFESLCSTPLSAIVTSVSFPLESNSQTYESTRYTFFVFFKNFRTSLVCFSSSCPVWTILNEWRN